MPNAEKDIMNLVCSGTAGLLNLLENNLSMHCYSHKIVVIVAYGQTMADS